MHASWLKKKQHYGQRAPIAYYEKNRLAKMSLFNLDQFRFMKKGENKEDPVCGTKSPDSEKENKPG